MSRRDQARPHLEEAQRFEAAGDYALAAEAYQRAVEADRTDLDATCRLARCQEARRRWSLAVDAWRHARTLRGDHPEVAVGLAEALRQARCHHAALSAYEDALSAHPGHLFALAGKGETLRMLGRYEDALPWFDAALEVHPEHAFALRGKAATLNALHRFDEALPLWAEALAIEPRSTFALQGRDETRRRLREQRAGGWQIHPPPAPPVLSSRGLAAESRAEWARALAGDERHHEAIETYRESLELEPERVEVLGELATTLESAGRWIEACEAYRAVLRLEPDRVDAACSVAETLRKADRFEEALAAYDRALQLDPSYVYALSGRAETLRMLGRNDEAIAAFDRALAHKPTHAFALRGKAATLNAMERFADAIPLWRRSLDLDPGARFALEGLHASEEGLSRRPGRREADPGRSRARAHFDVGRAYLQQGRTRDAIAALRKATEADPDWEEPWFLQGVAWEEDRQYHQAVRAFEACLLRRSDHSEAAIHRADSLRKLSDLDAAVRAYDDALELAPDDLRAVAGKAEALRLLGRFETALTWFDRALLAQPRHYFALCGKAATLNALHRFEEARPLWRMAREENPSSGFVQRGLAHCNAQAPAGLRHRPEPGDRRAARDALDRGRALRKAGDFNAAAASFKDAARHDPTWSEPLLRLGMLHEDQKQYARAIEAYEECLQVDARCYQAATNIGEAHRKSERYTQAIDAYDRALAIRQDYLYALAGRAECMRMLGQYRESLAWFDKALAQEPKHAFAVQGKAASLNALHRFDEALPLWNQALEIDRRSQFALDGKSYCEAQLRRGGGSSSGSRGASDTEAGESATPTLDEQGRDLTALARDGELGEIIGRVDEIRAVMKTLVRRQKANPLLLGDPGVGKTAVVEGLARALVEDDVPERLRHLRVIELSMGSLVAGTKYRGTFEDRLKKLVEEARDTPGVVLFIDEIHTLVGAGRTEGGSLDAANILKPALARGDITVIGATTLAEFRKNIEADSALERRFQPVHIEEPSDGEALELLRRLVHRYTDHHDVEVDDAALRACVQLAVRFVPDRHLPDKALDLLDEACAEASLEGHPVVTSTLVAKVLSDRTGIPVGQLTEEERDRLRCIEESLGAVVKGQDPAIARLARSVRLCRSGLRDPDKPRGVFLFAGPSGVGKTELARRLADYLFPEGNAFIRLDMSEYAEKFTMSRLIGAPPGYAGHGEPGQLTGQLRRRPYAVVLLDEFEKAHPEVQTLFLSLFDEGHVTDAEGRQVDAREALFILTSNAGTEVATRGRVGFGGRPDGLDTGLLLDGVKDRFRPELLNRIDEVVPFRPLEGPHLEAVVVLHLERLAERARGEGVHLTWDPEVVVACATRRADPAYGARPALRAIDTLVGEPLGERLLEGAPGRTRHLHATLDGERVTFEERAVEDSADTLEGV
jgi:ATP-dependent Clp protease ATP-binding subunit ClpC